MENTIATSIVPPVEGSDRPRREPLTRARIIEAALRIMDEEGLDAVTMRRVGRQLGVEAMSLYNHVRDKEDILDGVSEAVLSEFRIPQTDDWDEAARQTAREWRRLLLAHPSVVTLMTERKRPFTNPESLTVYEFALDLFRRAGLPVEESVKAFHTFGGFILGMVTMELGPMVGGAAHEAHLRGHDEMARLIDSSALPRLQEALPHLIDCDVEEQFEFGLSLLIDGLRSRAPTVAEGASA